MRQEPFPGRIIYKGTHSHAQSYSNMSMLSKFKIRSLLPGDWWCTGHSVPGHSDTTRLLLHIDGDWNRLQLWHSGETYRFCISLYTSLVMLDERDVEVAEFVSLHLKISKSVLCFSDFYALFLITLQ